MYNIEFRDNSKYIDQHHTRCSYNVKYNNHCCLGSYQPPVVKTLHKYILKCKQCILVCKVNKCICINKLSVDVNQCTL